MHSAALRTQFLFWGWIISPSTDITLLFSFLTDEHLGRSTFGLWWIMYMNVTILNIDIHIFVWLYGFVFLENIPMNRIAGLCGNSKFHHLKICPIVLQSGSTIYFLISRMSVFWILCTLGQTWLVVHFLFRLPAHK